MNSIDIVTIIIAAAIGTIGGDLIENALWKLCERNRRSDEKD